MGPQHMCPPHAWLQHGRLQPACIQHAKIQQAQHTLYLYSQAFFDEQEASAAFAALSATHYKYEEIGEHKRAWVAFPDEDLAKAAMKKMREDDYVVVWAKGDLEQEAATVF